MTTSADEVARRNTKRPGMRLVTYREVGLPYWKLPVRCRFLARKPLPVLEEFVLRCLQADLRVSEKIARFLTLPIRFVESVMADLIRTGHISPITGDGVNVHYALTEKGQTSLSEMATITPEERVIELAYDGMTRRFEIVDDELRWRPRELRGNDILEIPAFPADPPEVRPSDTDSVSTVLRGVPNLGEVDLLSTMGLDGKREKFFIRAVALVYESIDRIDDVTVNFVIDGRPSPDHDHAFARAEGQRKLGILGALQSDRASIEAVVGSEVLAQRADEEHVSALRRTTESYAAELASVRERSSAAEGEDLTRLSEQAESVAEKLDNAEAALGRIPVRILEVHEHPEMLSQSLTRAQSRLMIVSPWIRSAVVDETFVNQIKKLLTGGVSVSIAYGINDKKASGDGDKRAEESLRELADEHDGFSFTRLGDTHAKVLIKDNDFAIVTSFNWLSFKGDPNRPFRDERGTLIAISSEIDRLYDDYARRMAAAADSNAASTRR